MFKFHFDRKNQFSAYGKFEITVNHLGNKILFSITEEKLKHGQSSNSLPNHKKNSRLSDHNITIISKVAKLLELKVRK